MSPSKLFVLTSNPKFVDSLTKAMHEVQARTKPTRWNSLKLPTKPLKQVRVNVIRILNLSELEPMKPNDFHVIVDLSEPMEQQMFSQSQEHITFVTTKKSGTPHCGLLPIFVEEGNEVTLIEHIFVSRCLIEAGLMCQDA
jgi:hypothetical protein